MTATIDALTTTAVTVSRACALLGMARSTYYRLSRACQGVCVRDLVIIGC